MIRSRNEPVDKSVDGIDETAALVALQVAFEDTIDLVDPRRRSPGPAVLADHFVP